MDSLHVVLFRPEIPQNTGNIARTCAAVGAKLHLIKPLGFSLRDRYLKRAGLDYWSQVEVETHQDMEEFFSKAVGGNHVFLTKTGCKSHDKIPCLGDLFLIFGSETEGLPPELLDENRKRCFRIPMKAGARSLNLSNAVAVVVYETLRQRGYAGLEHRGK